ncbi:squalene/phytoene synthase family protein [Pseudooceanicola algae]|uniref:Hydroxysqualene synthase n=1 Tax=Pseudooceanicola algae TaxID=1537215 RepID=A0A418SIB3_9RHOB|nr:squalene/phytoene synthase family protein [Pseudooceanicola algae]QPM88989.1 Hydroxysqualene synthase [Pseudooceanicola algae]
MTHGALAMQSENFPVASRLIRRDLRGDVMTFYTFARTADDMADDPARSPAERMAWLEAGAGALRGTLTDRPTGSLVAAAQALREALSHRDPALLTHPEALLTAFRQDARGRIYASDADLLDYCQYSAVPVGRFLLDLHGEGPDCTAPSDALCSALQILNHLQDITEDKVRLGRVYLPGNRLRAAGVNPRDLTADKLTPALRQVVDGLLDLCDDLLAKAAPLPRRIAARGLAGEAASILWLARDLSRRLRHDDPLARRVAPSPFAFLRAALVGSARCLRPGALVPSR